MHLPNQTSVDCRGMSGRSAVPLDLKSAISMGISLEVVVVTTYFLTECRRLGGADEKWKREAGGVKKKDERKMELEETSRLKEQEGQAELNNTLRDGALPTGPKSHYQQRKS